MISKNFFYTILESENDKHINSQREEIANSVPEIIVTEEPEKPAKSLWKKTAGSAGILTKSLVKKPLLPKKETAKKSLNMPIIETAPEPTQSDDWTKPIDSIIIASADDKSLTQCLVDAVHYGMILIVTNVDTHLLPESFANVLIKRRCKDENGTDSYQILQGCYPCHENFSLILLTRSRLIGHLLNKNFGFACSNFIDATMSMHHLAGSLLSKIMHMDRTDFDTARRKFEGQLLNFEQLV